MDSSQDSPTPTPRPTGKKRSATRWVVATVLGLLLFGLIVLVVVPVRTEPTMVWLTPAQAQQISNPGMLTRVTQSAKIWFVGIWRRFFRSPATGWILLQIQVFTVSPQANLPALLGPPTSTNADGRKAWILAASDYAARKPNLKQANGLAGVFSPSVLTIDGQQARMMMGGTVPVGPPGQSPNKTGPPASPTVFAGYSVDVVPQSIPGVARLVRLQVMASSTEIGTVTATNVILQTNFFTASRTLVPSGGALVIECPNADATNPTNCLIIVYPAPSGLQRATPMIRGGAPGY